jgi:hypothetical protein
MGITFCTTRSTGYMPTVAVWNSEIVDNMNWLSGSRPSCKAYRTTGQTVGSVTQSIIGFDLERWDVGSIHSTAVNNSRFTVPSGAAGRWRLTATMRPVYIASSYFSFIEPLINGSQTTDRVTGVHNIDLDAGVHITAEYQLNVGDYLELTAYHLNASAVDWIGNCLVEWVSR